MELPEIIARLKGNPSPSELSNIKIYLAADYAFLAGQLGEILKVKPEAWVKLRDLETCSSDKQADRAWDRTAQGLEETSLRLKMKSIEKILSAISSRIQVASEELHGNY